MIFGCGDVCKVSPSLEGFAKHIALSSKDEISLKDKLTTLSSSVFIPENNWVDEPVSSGDLVGFWRAYSEYVKKRS